MSEKKISQFLKQRYSKEKKGLLKKIDDPMEIIIEHFSKKEILSSIQQLMTAERFDYDINQINAYEKQKEEEEEEEERKKEDEKRKKEEEEEQKEQDRINDDIKHHIFFGKQLLESEYKIISGIFNEMDRQAQNLFQFRIEIQHDPIVFVTEDSRIIRLSLRNSNLTDFPENIEYLTALRYLDLSKNKLEKVSNNIGNLRSLIKLDLSHNNLSSLPESIGNLRSLINLDLSYNYLSSLPESIGNLEHLKSLDLSENYLEEDIKKYEREKVYYKNNPYYQPHKPSFPFNSFSKEAIMALKKLQKNSCIVIPFYTNLNIDIHFRTKEGISDQ